MARIDQEKWTTLHENSIEVIEEVAKPNGAIVAAPSGFSTYSPNMENYHFVWVRDAAFISAAATLVGRQDIAENFFRWMLERAEKFGETGFMANAYTPNGSFQGTRLPLNLVSIPKDLRRERREFNFYGLQFQPDQYGHLLWAIHQYVAHTGNTSNETVRQLASTIVEGIDRFWKGTHFSIPYFNLWEDYIAYPEDKANFTYTLAICWRGLQLCCDALGEYAPPRAEELAREFRTAFEQCFREEDGTCMPVSYLYGSGSRQDTGAAQQEAAVVGLAWPAEAVAPEDDTLASAIAAVEEHNVTPAGGIKRHPRGGYSGRLESGSYIFTGEGAWPMLHFWYAIYWHMRGDEERARERFAWVLERVGDYIPEQIFDDPNHPVICPLAWSHAMFVLSSAHLGILNKA